jgi:hypothetical protein
MKAVDLCVHSKMSAAFSIEKPTVVAILPRPVDHSTGRYVVSEVHGGVPGSRKRKRSELVVGVDGEGLSIYDVRFVILVENRNVLADQKFPDSILKTHYLICPPATVVLYMSSLFGPLKCRWEEWN